MPSNLFGVPQGGGGVPFAPTFLQASHINNFIFAAINTPEPIPINTNDELEGGIIHPTGVGNEVITVVADGVYYIAAQPQVLANSAGIFRMYLQIDTGGGFTDVANSNVELSLPNNQEDVIPLISMMRMGAGDAVRVMGVVDDVNIILETVTPAGEPVVPSIIVTFFRVF